MTKIYKDKNGNLYSKELETIYYVNTLNTEINEVDKSIVSWYKGADVPDSACRVYDLEVNGEKFLFDLKYENHVYYFVPSSNIEMTRLKSQYNIEVISEEEPIS